jgi:hypothetical protein
MRLMAAVVRSPPPLVGFCMRGRMSGMIIRIVSFVAIAVVLELLNGFLTFLLPPFMVITPICLLLGVIWAFISRPSKPH